MKKISITAFSVILACGTALAAQISTRESVGATLKEYTSEKRKEEVSTRLASPRTEPPALDEKEIEKLPRGAESKYIRKILIQQAALLEDYERQEEPLNFTKIYENKSLTLEDMKKLAADITDKFLKKEGRAYIPEQSFNHGTLYINITADEGTVQKGTP